ncbi:MAG: ribosome maturation factor RimP [Bacillota bacterium]
MRTAETVQSLVGGLVEQMGYELVEVEFTREAAGWVLTLYIDSPNGIKIEDCERVSRAVEPLLDEADPIEQAYYLSVSSLGLDRPIKKDRDFERNLNKQITVKLYAPLNKKKEYAGTLISFDAERFSLLLEGAKEPLTINRKDAAMIKPYFRFE